MKHKLSAANRKRLQRVGTVISVGFTIAFLVLVAHRFASDGWPLKQADPLLCAMSLAIMLAAALTEAYAWQRLVQSDPRPNVRDLAAANGAGALGRLVFMELINDGIRFWSLKRFPSGRQCAATGAGVSIGVGAMMDFVNLLPFAVFVAATTTGGMQLAMAIYAALAAATVTVVLYGRRLLAHPRIARLRLFAAIGKSWAEPFDVLRCWLADTITFTLRTVAAMVLLAALSVHVGLALMVSVMCVSKAVSMVPVGFGTAATRVGVGVVVLSSAAVSATTAAAFMVSMQVLLAIAGGLLLLVLPAAALARALRRFLHFPQTR